MRLALAVFVLAGCGVGAPGAPVWFANSSGLRITQQGGYVRPPSSWSTCVAVSRSELSPAQLKYLEGLRLMAPDGKCTADGWNFVELVVTDSNGERTYRDESCMKPDVGQLPAGVWEQLGAPGGPACP